MGDVDIKCKTGLAKKAFIDTRNVSCAKEIGLGIRKRSLKY